MELLSISPEHASLAIELAAASAVEPCTLTPQQEAVLLTPPPEVPPPMAQAIEVTVQRLAAAGIVWEPQRA